MSRSDCYVRYGSRKSEVAMRLVNLKPWVGMKCADGRAHKWCRRPMRAPCEHWWSWDREEGRESAGETARKQPEKTGGEAGDEEEDDDEMMMVMLVVVRRRKMMAIKVVVMTDGGDDGNGEDGDDDGDDGENDGWDQDLSFPEHQNRFH